MSPDDYDGRCIFGVWKDRAAIRDQYCIYGAQDSACADTGSYNTCAERDLVEYYDFEYSERCAAVSDGLCHIMRERNFIYNRGNNLPAAGALQIGSMQEVHCQWQCLFASLKNEIRGIIEQ